MSIRKKDQLYDRITKIEKHLYFFKHLGSVKLSNSMRTKSKRTESNQNEPNQNEPNRNEPNRNETKSIESNRIEFRVRIKFESFTVQSLL